MMHEVSAGVVPYNPKTKKFLLLHYPSGQWGFPKGHVEEGETELEAAKRELKEETGLSANVLFGFKMEISFFYKNKKEGKLSHKRVIYFVGITNETEVKLSYEHDAYKWVNYEEALKTITYKDERQVLERATEFLEATGYSVKE